MAKKRYLRKQQYVLIEELVNGELDEAEALKKYGVRRSTFEKWLGDRLFVDELGRQVDGLKRRSELIVARRKSMAAVRLAELTASDKPETARKACLDIMRLDEASDFGSVQVEAKDSDEDARYEDLSAETASRLLAVLAEDGGV